MHVLSALVKFSQNLPILDSINFVILFYATICRPYFTILIFNIFSFFNLFKMVY